MNIWDTLGLSVGSTVSGRAPTESGGLARIWMGPAGRLQGAMAQEPSAAGRMSRLRRGLAAAASFLSLHFQKPAPESDAV
jgi:hypothetical protein